MSSIKAIVLAVVMVAGVPGLAAPLQVSNSQMSVTVDCSSGLNLTSIFGKWNSHEYLSAPTPLLSYSVNAASASDYFDGAFANLKCVQNGNTIGITATSPDGLTAFTITLAPETATAAPSGLEAVVVSTQVGYSGPNSPTLLRAKLPNVQTFQVPGSNANAMAMVPQEMGSVLPLSNLNAAAPWDLGASYLFTDRRIGLPVSFNVLEVAEVYDPNGNEICRHTGHFHVAARRNW